MSNFFDFVMVLLPSSMILLHCYFGPNRAPKTLGMPKGQVFFRPAVWSVARSRINAFGVPSANFLQPQYESLPALKLQGAGRLGRACRMEATVLRSAPSRTPRRAGRLCPVPSKKPTGITAELRGRPYTTHDLTCREGRISATFQAFAWK